MVRASFACMGHLISLDWVWDWHRQIDSVSLLLSVLLDVNYVHKAHTARLATSSAVRTHDVPMSVFVLFLRRNRVNDCILSAISQELSLWLVEL